jgi:hypothetical protein
MTIAPFAHLADLMGLPPDRLWSAIGLLAAFITVAELVRLSLSTTATTSVTAHLLRCLLTFPIQSVSLAIVLVVAALRFPERAWLNLGIVLSLYVLWYLVGQLTSLARSDNEGADLGFMCVGSLVTFPTGLLMAVLC